MIVHGSVTVPGDKSLTHRLLLLAGLAPGQSRISGALTSLDAQATAELLRQLGVGVSPLRTGEPVLIDGRSRWRQPGQVLDCSNSGTSARLALGLLAGHSFAAQLTGDGSLRRRPMDRVTEPLTAMGARFDPPKAERLPLTIHGGPLSAIEWQLPVSSAQIKGCLLFAGVAGGVPVALHEPGGRSREHTERLLQAFGYSVKEDEAGWIRFAPTGTLAPLDVEVPGDLSSAAFLVAAALLAETGSLRVTGVGLNPTRTGFLSVLNRMGARVTVTPTGERCGEPVGDLTARPGPLYATTIKADEIPGLIDEIPILAVLASRALGQTHFHNVGELRVKESDRLALLAENLRAVGASAVVESDTLTIEGGHLPPAGRVRTEGDHRIAMAFAVLDLAKGARVEVDDLACATVSFPDFEATLNRISKPESRRVER